MTNRDWQLVQISQARLQEHFPGPAAHPVATATIRENEQTLRVSVVLFHVAPPPDNGIGGKFGRFGIGAHKHMTPIVLQFINPIGHSDAICLRSKVMIIDSRRIEDDGIRPQ